MTKYSKVPILAIDTSTSYLSLALAVNTNIYTRHLNVGNKQSEQILPQITELFNQAGILASDLGQIVYSAGPGTFTGLRIGIGVAQGLATPFDTPLQGVQTLDCIAEQKFHHPCVLAAIDARMGEVFYAWYDTLNHQRLSDYCLGKAEEIRLPAGYQDAVGVGNAYTLDNPPPFSGSSDMPTAANYLALANSGRYPLTSAANAELLYIRNKIALTTKKEAANKGIA